MSKVFLSIYVVWLFTLPIFATNTVDTVEVLRIYNLVGTYDDPVKIRFPDNPNLITLLTGMGC